MRIPAGKNFIVELEQPERTGTTWVVKVFQRRFPFKKLISSEWVLEREQAQNFARQLADALNNGADPMMLKNRKPGWTIFDSQPTLKQTAS